MNRAKYVSGILKVIANENRLFILCELIRSPMTVSALCARMPHITQSALSQHLSVLKAHRMVDYTKSGQNVTYFIVDDRVKEIIGALSKFYCDDEGISE